MNTLNEFGQHLAHLWLASLPVWSPELVETGETYLGSRVLTYNYRRNGEEFSLRLYRYTPLGSQHPVLAFMPEWGD